MVRKVNWYFTIETSTDVLIERYLNELQSNSFPIINKVIKEMHNPGIDF